MKNTERAIRMRTCEVCGRNLTEGPIYSRKQDHYRQEHPEYMFKHSSLGQLQCGRCGIVVSSYPKLVAHHQIHHGEDLAKPPDVLEDLALAASLDHALSTTRDLIALGEDPSVVFWKGQMKVAGELLSMYKAILSANTILRDQVRRLLKEKEVLEQMVEAEKARRSREVMEEAEKALAVHSND